MTRWRIWGVVVLATGLVLAGFTVRAADEASVPRQRNLIANGSFERSLGGWSAINARLSRVHHGAAGRIAARVSITPGARDFSIFSPVHVPAAPGVVYSAGGFVRSPRRLPVCLSIREWSGEQVLNSVQRCVSTRSRWRKFPVVRLTVAGGSRHIDVYAFRLRAGRGSRFDVDGIYLHATPARPLPPLPSGGPLLIAAGDIAKCSGADDEATAALVERLQGTIATLGDNAYDNGTREEFARCYDPSWGRFKARTRPSPGNHEYNSRGAVPYYEYFGAAAGERGKGYYSYTLGTWHVIALNSNCAAIGGCGPGSPQERWLRADLQANRARCTLAYWHHPRFSSGAHGSDPGLQAFWQALYEARADVVLSGHDHDYERFAPQTPAGTLNRAQGIRQFVVGTGGGDLRPIGAAANSEVRNSDTHGVLVLALRPGTYAWRFVPEAGRAFTDLGSSSCH